ncbi:aminotransferase class V-fold PLP-dependent enzyme [Janthinobacterium fluminis]|uniref:cysteine desulfurase n=1 Tax=Janthinobacterium fluminis TaxID=2987524 RepID=A0ABT5K7P4_9BURK|nr:aminotransferase class V-fold PLP-dependent enzyme [Janthinobacterium fluminis]MDC8760821.1 aminotransferase class V-fold PLP-dependent enzyme [Janthinobacterium fluminis]
MMTEIYLDGNATTAVLPAAAAAALHAMAQGFGNPSSTHATGLQAKAMLDGARARARRVVGAGDGRLMFNSGATEGIQTAVLSALCALRARRARGERTGSVLLYGATEHKAVPESLAHWNRLLGLDLELRALPVDGDGRHDLAALRAQVGEAALLCTMAANNETGVISDLDGIAAVLADSGSDAYWLVDCVQALGKLALNLGATRIDYAPFSGHKLYAPKGVGMLYVRAGAPFTPLIAGGGQESGQRSGTENMAGIAALGAVLAALEDGAVFRSHTQLEAMRERLVASLRRALPGVVFNMPMATSLPTTLNFSVPGLASKELLDLFDAARVRVSSGSACSSSKAAPSYVLEAMRLPHWRSGAAIRMSFGPHTDLAMIADACARIERCGEALRASCLVPSELAPSARDGVIQLGVDGACTWLLTDAASRSCVIIDPLAPLAGRLAAYVRCQDYRVAAILHTQAPPDGGAARQALLDELGGHGAAPAGDALGWPAHAAPLALGPQALVRVAAGAGRAYYLLGRAGAGGVAPQDVRFAFTGALAAAELDAARIELDTLLCPGHDEQNLLCSSLRAERGLVAAVDAGANLSAAGLEAFLLSHPNALLIDVREAYEHAAGGAAALGGRAALSVPLSRLGEHVGDWLRGERVPLVFFCRSGNRSGKAVACLHRLGYAAAWHVSGGMALGEAALAPLARAA